MEKDKLIHVILAVPAESSPESAAERRVAAELLAKAIGEQARVVEVSDEARVETIAQIVTAFDELKRGVAEIQQHLDEIQSSIPEMNIAFERVSEAVAALQPEQPN
jgi:methyl-accepting chemotaxis protein